MSIVASGQITITDFNDAVSLTAFISSNQPKTQIYNPDNDTYTPDWSKSPYLVLTPSLYVAGTAADIISSSLVQSVMWFDSTDMNTRLTSNDTYTVQTTGTRALMVRKNILDKTSSKDFIAVIIYRDPGTGLELTINADISLSKVVNGGGIADAIATTPNGNIFKNDINKNLTASCYLYRGSVIDSTAISYQWYRQDSSVTSDEGAGTGWKKLTSTVNYGISGYNSPIITIPSSAVLNVATFKCVIIDTDNTSSSYNQKFFDVVSFVDQSDPYQVTVESTGGTAFKNGIGSSTLRARLFQAGAELDVSGNSGFVYKWYKYDSNGNLVSDFGGTSLSYKTGKSITVGDADVNTKATFKVEVEK